MFTITGFVLQSWKFEHLIWYPVTKHLWSPEFLTFIFDIFSDISSRNKVNNAPK